MVGLSLASPVGADAVEALLLLDVQAASVAHLSAGEKLVDGTRQALQVVREAGLPVVHVRTAVSKEERGWAPSHSVLGRGSNLVAPDADSPEGAVHHRLAPRPGETCLRKTRLSAFHRTDLDEQLTVLGVTTLYVAGMSTSGAVLATVIDAVDRDYEVAVLADCTADNDAGAQQCLTDVVLPRYAEVVTLDRFSATISDLVAKRDLGSIQQRQMRM